MKNNDKIQQIIDQINRVKHFARLAEISLYSKSLNHHKVVKSKKLYTRKSKHKRKFEDYD